jgi:serine/threonine-protein kinase
LHDELVTQLSKVAALKVISRTSVMGYTGPNIPPLKQIASELGVGTVVEASVQVVGNRLRVNVQLIDAATDAPLWGEHYDRTLDDAFAIQSEVARQIVAAIGATLSGEETRGLAAAPTANAEAYRLYLQAREYRNRPGTFRQNIEIAQQLFERALALDPKFALAHAALSEVHGLMYFFPNYDHTPARAARQRAEAEIALRLTPDLPQAHFALGIWHYRSQRDYPRALAELRIASRGLPNDAEIWAGIGQVTRRMGNANESVVAHEKTTQLSPRNWDMAKELAVTYAWMRRYSDAVVASNRALSLRPDLPLPALVKGKAYLLWQGQLDTLRAAVRSHPAGALREDRLDLLRWDRRADSMLEVCKAAAGGVFTGQTWFLPAALYAAWSHRLRGDRAAARDAFESARVFLDSVLKELPDDERVHAARGLALAGLGRRDDALNEAEWLEQSVAYRDDKYQGPIVAENRARILAQVGDADAALDEIESLLASPGQIGTHVLRLDPLWDPIRTHPRFQRLLAKSDTR